MKLQLAVASYFKSPCHTINTLITLFTKVVCIHYHGTSKEGKGSTIKFNECTEYSISLIHFKRLHRTNKGKQKLEETKSSTDRLSLRAVSLLSLLTISSLKNKMKLVRKKKKDIW